MVLHRERRYFCSKKMMGKKKGKGGGVCLTNGKGVYPLSG